MKRVWSLVLVLVLSCVIGVQSAEAKGKKGGGKKAPPTAESVFSKMDADKDGTVTEKEFVAYTLQKNKKSNEAKAQKAYERLGGSKDKGLKLEQFRPAWEEIQKKAAERKAKKQGKNK